MSGNQEVTYRLDFRAGSERGRKNNGLSSDRVPPVAEAASPAIPRIARLMALAIRLEGMLRDETFQDYAELARRGRVTRARITQIMKLLNLAADIQERILFLPPVKGLNESCGPLSDGSTGASSGACFRRSAICNRQGSVLRFRHVNVPEPVRISLARQPKKSDECDVPD